LHAKVAVIDGHWDTVGSSNLDPLSLLLAREANVVVDDVAFAQKLQARLEHAMQAEGTRVDPEDYANRPLVQRLLDRVAYVIMRTLLFINGKRY
jgi:cardiolipin synthase